MRVSRELESYIAYRFEASDVRVHQMPGRDVFGIAVTLPDGTVRRFEASAAGGMPASLLDDIDAKMVAFDRADASLV